MTRRYERQPPVCIVDGCDHRPDSRGWCRMHYERWRRHGNPATIGRRGWPLGRLYPEVDIARRAQACSLRQGGLTYKTIGNALGVSYQRAQQLVQAALTQQPPTGL